METKLKNTSAICAIALLMGAAPATAAWYADGSMPFTYSISKVETLQRDGDWLVLTLDIQNGGSYLNSVHFFCTASGNGYDEWTATGKALNVAPNRARAVRIAEKGNSKRPDNVRCTISGFNADVK